MAEAHGARHVEHQIAARLVLDGAADELNRGGGIGARAF
jgi:hypothetical protein